MFLSHSRVVWFAESPMNRLAHQSVPRRIACVSENWFLLVRNVVTCQKTKETQIYVPLVNGGLLMRSLNRSSQAPRYETKNCVYIRFIFCLKPGLFDCESNYIDESKSYHICYTAHQREFVMGYNLQPMHIEDKGSQTVWLEHRPRSKLELRDTLFT